MRLHRADQCGKGGGIGQIARHQGAVEIGPERHAILSQDIQQVIQMPQHGVKAFQRQAAAIGAQKAGGEVQAHKALAVGNGAQLPVTALVDQFYGDVQEMGGNRWDTSSLLARLERK